MNNSRHHLLPASPGVNEGLAIWLFMMDRHSRPLPLTKFSENTSGSMCLMLEALT